jgi:hypothetical protein
MVTPDSGEANGARGTQTSRAYNQTIPRQNEIVRPTKKTFGNVTQLATDQRFVLPLQRIF